MPDWSTNCWCCRSDVVASCKDRCLFPCRRGLEDYNLDDCSSFSADACVDGVTKGEAGSFSLLCNSCLIIMEQEAVEHQLVIVSFALYVLFFYFLLGSYYFRNDIVGVQLEDHLRGVQIQLENLMWEKQEVEEHLQAALKDCQVMEAMLAEVEEEQDKSSAKVEELESELQELREENLRLKEIWGKDRWGSKGLDVDSRFPLVAEHGVPSWNSGLKGSGRMAVRDLIRGKEWERELEKSVLLKPGSKAARTLPFSPRLISTSMAVEEALDERRYTAVLQSLFSTLLSILVGMVVWEARDPCMPLVVALFTVVGISLKSVVQFFSTIKVKPASDAVGLLSFNCFILGTITYPTLPAVARTLLPPTLRLAARTIRWFGFSV